MYIYKITNLINNKIYFGQRSSDYKTDSHYYGSGSVIQKAIKKYGKENFKKEIVKLCKSKQDLDNWEKLIILIGKQHKYGCYNISIGGDGWTKGMKRSDTTRLKMSISANNRQPVSDETRNRITLALTGRKLTQMTKDKISKSHIGKRVSEITKQKLSILRKGKTMSEDTKDKISMKNKGRKHTKEAIEKIRLSKIGRKRPHSAIAKENMRLAALKRRTKKVSLNDTLLNIINHKFV